MTYKGFNLQDVKILSSSVMPILALAVTKVLSPILQASSEYAPGSQALTLPTSVQGTGYFVKHPDSFRR